MKRDDQKVASRVLRVDVIEQGRQARPGCTACEIGGDLTFSTSHLESYCLVQWEPVIFDALVVAAAVEFCDRIQRRLAHHCGRTFELLVPVHDPDRWNAPAVNAALKAALDFLTGDCWQLSFVARNAPAYVPQQFSFEVPGETRAVIAFSEGLDSRAVAGLMHREYGDGLIRVRLGTKRFEAPTTPSDKKQPFTSIPYDVKPKTGEFVESSARSRGFKFATMSGIAAYLVKADKIIVTESGQGSIGPVLVPVGQGYEDYRSYPLFTDRMEKFLHALLGHRVHFDFPRLWSTKGETLAAFVKECNDGSTWNKTRSCWQQTRHSSVAGKLRQCGICAACMLRRLSVHAAGLTEDRETYIWEDLASPTFEEGAGSAVEHITKSKREYAIAGVLHLEHLADLQKSAMDKVAIDLAITELSRSRGMAVDATRSAMTRLLNQHESEWMNFLDALGPNSFVTAWVGRP
jgi:7-cyano-7-deazaguanine synthase in queuosine biosynthesis